MSMADSQKLPVNWIERWLRIDFYKECCDKHESKYKTVTCYCMDERVCDICWREYKHQHEDHRYLQVFRASWRTAVEVGEIRKYYDASQIITYIINRKRVVYLNPNEDADVAKKGPKCDFCSRRINDPKFKFCSIACKMKAEGFVNLQNNDAVAKNHQTESTRSSLWMRPELLPPRKRSLIWRYPCESLPPRKRRNYGDNKTENYLVGI